MKRYFCECVLFSFLIVGCASTTENNSTPPVATATRPSATATKSLPSGQTPTATSYQLVFPSVTMSPQENENALFQLLTTNGYCRGKCIGGMYPDEMNVQDAVHVMSQWGMVTTNQNSIGQTYIGLKPATLYGQLNVSLAVGTWTKELETIDTLDLELHGSRSYYVDKSVWQANQDALQGFRMDNLLKTYGVPSYVGYDFYVSPASVLPKGDTVEYGMSLHFDQINLHILNSGMAYYDGKYVFLCPSKETHALHIVINPHRPLTELRNVFPVTWQGLTNTDLDAFYATLTGENAFDLCTKTTLEQILALKPHT
jgi:hypothetical protein